ncbi:AraC family transcriptional regulator [Staphylococcus agnetis]|uniref:AraC family transcriptional regulator n=1 Tax=Staphylococcus agnetis TaxID=985762 RepID=UPI00208F2EC7|nr:AraC family transcriptional regulator [Staphylococcus agnetis]MCO4339196.1 AraC family transcriptional regulator [Staphylococcus agnetis]MCO4345974.1 AraC family transcriptional regulator [Staphylococcus agnetis]MCO4348138.1 AraC family transcriptional regulator [Staphylococcus agnetis]MCO4350446.1 AraC family transcriptional regulator [Staphylococcus agnetis]MCO4355441.1 AraC family transcriptional regulator [Staphylococcus agnetis]
MDVIKYIQQAIIYIEDHLYESYDLQHLSDYVELSPYHLSQSFLMITGQTPEDYYKARRLTLAAKELKQSNARLIDIAKKYHYSDVNAFAHDFSDYHGVSPLQVKTKSDQLNMQPQIYLKLTTTTKPAPPFRYEHIGDFGMVGYSRFIPSQDIESPFNVPDFLEDLKADGRIDDLIKYNDCGPHDLFVVRCPLEHGLELFVGVPSERMPSHLEYRYLDRRQYAMFNLQGEMDYAVTDAWHYIETTLQFSMPYEKDTLYLEVYPFDFSFDHALTKIQLGIPLLNDDI